MDLDEIIETFEALEPGEERYRYLIDLGKEVPGLPDHEKTDDALVRGCQSQVWLRSEIRDGRLLLRADSDAFIVRGLVAILLAIFHGRTLDEVRAADARGVFQRIGLDGHLSMGRRNGLYAMIQRISAMAS
jgi:cysteine desulfuration protein SufE